MYTSNGNNIDPIFFYSSAHQHQPLLFPKQLPNLSPFTFALEDHKKLSINGIFHHHQYSLAEAAMNNNVPRPPEDCHNKINDATTTATATRSSSSRNKEIIRGRCWIKSTRSKRDRHSKINTAKGPRDRRMRLSLEVARRFFGLQDVLGFDKASKTVEWLLNQAKREIKKLEADNNNNNINIGIIHGVSGDPSPSSIIRGKSKASRKACSVHKHVSLGRESRVKARERARERTKEKMRRRKLISTCDAVADDHRSEESRQTQNVNPCFDVAEIQPSNNSQQARQNPWSTVLDEDEDDEDSLVPMTKWSPSMFFSSLHSSGLLHEDLGETIFCDSWLYAII